jgi:hypothetical protein
MKITQKLDQALTLGSLPSAPSSPENGTMYYNSTDSVIYFRENDVWEVKVNLSELANYYTKAEIDNIIATLTTDDIEEGATNQYFTVTRARNAVVVNSMAGSQIDQAPSVQSVKDYVAAEIATIDLTDYYTKTETDLLLADKADQTALDQEISDRQAADALLIPLTQKAAPNGVATLDGAGKIPVNQLPSAVMTYEGTWDASTNSPTLADGVGDAGMVYLVSVAGTQNLGSGAITFAVGDWVVYNGSIWQKSTNSNIVMSVNGYTGVVVLTKADIGLDQVDNTSDADKPISTATQAALDLKADITYVDAEVAAVEAQLADYLKKDGSVAMTGDLDLGGNDIVNAVSLTTGNTVFSSGSIASSVPTSISVSSGAITLNPATSVDVSSKKITNLAVGTASTDAVNKSQLDLKQDELPAGTNGQVLAYDAGGEFIAKSLTTSDIPEGSNLYYTDSRARTAAVVNSTAGNETDQAPSVSSIKTYVNSQGFLKNVVEDTTPELGGNLDVLANAIESSTSDVVLAGQVSVKRAKQASKSNFVEEEYVHAVALAASQTNASIASFTFPIATYDAVEITYKMKNASNATRIGTIRLITDGTNAFIQESHGSSTNLHISFDAIISGGNMILNYTSSTEGATMRADVKKFLL